MLNLLSTTQFFASERLTDVCTLSMLCSSLHVERSNHVPALEFLKKLLQGLQCFKEKVLRKYQKS